MYLSFTLAMRYACDKISYLLSPNELHYTTEQDLAIDVLKIANSFN